MVHQNKIVKNKTERLFFKAGENNPQIRFILPSGLAKLASLFKKNLNPIKLNVKLAS
jgi:hypothetical protein